MKQLNLFEEMKTAKSVHGGARTKGRRKAKRPLSTKHTIHLVLKSKKARGAFCFFKHKAAILKVLKTYSQKYGVQIKDAVNMGNHIHLKVKIRDRKLFGHFLRTVTALIARKITGATKAHAFGRFWDGIPFTRILKTSYEELQLKGYFNANRVERAQSYHVREQYLKQFNEWVYKLRRRKLLENSGPLLTR
jgi:REP element-mobilizing transposase RayT